MQLSDDIIYIKDTETIDYYVDEAIFYELTSDAVTDIGGEIAYGAPDAPQFEEIEPDDILCVYVGVKPTERDVKDGGQRRPLAGSFWTLRFM